MDQATGQAPSTAVDTIVAQYRRRLISAEVAVAQLLVELRSVANVRRAIRARGAAGLERLIDEHDDGCADVEAILSVALATSASPANPPVQESVARVARMFDACVRQSEEASVALYSLGSAERLAAATHEVVELFATRGWSEASRRALDVGCGIGRIASALAPRLLAIDGVDVSPAMIDAARRRCAAHRNVRIVLGSGIDLAPWPDAQFDLVYAVDAFPYIVGAGAALLDGYFAEMARVLAPGGDLVILNWSYRQDPEADGAEATELAARHGLRLQAASACPFTLWDGREFWFRS